MLARKVVLTLISGKCRRGKCGVDRRGGKCRSNNGWKAVRKV